MSNIAECKCMLTLNDDGSYEEFDEGDWVNLELYSESDGEYSVCGEIISVGASYVTLSEDGNEIDVQLDNITGWF